MSAKRVQGFSLAELLRPVDGVDVNAERIFAQSVSITWGFDDDGDDCRPALGRSELTAVVSAFGPSDPKAIRRGAYDAGDLDRDLRVAELGKGVVGARIIIQSRGASIGREVVGSEPILPQHDGVGRQTAHIFDEAREMKRDLRIGRLI